MTITENSLSQTQAVSIQPAKRLRRARGSWLLGSDVWWISVFVVVVTVGLWVRHGGWDLLLAGGTSTWLALGQLTGLLAALVALAGIVLTARPRLLERKVGLDRLLGWHRWVGTTAVFLVVLHSVIDTVAWAMSANVNVIQQTWSFIRNDAWMLAAVIGTVLFVVIGLTSWHRIKNTMSYETWYFVHLLGYMAVLLAFGHQLTLGADFVSDTLAMWWWVALAAFALAIIVIDRFGDFVKSIVRGPFRIAHISHEAHGVGSLHIMGPGISKLRVSAGQYFMLRVMNKKLWWQAHPFSLSAAPSTAGLRFTVKALGEDSAEILKAAPGTRVFLEGPYGVFTADAAHGEPVLLVGGGVGLAPLRAVIEDCHPSQRPVLIARVSKDEEFMHRAELEKLLAARNGVLHLMAGPREWFGGGDPFHPRELQRLVPDIRQRHIYLCGPASMESAVERSARKLKVPSGNIHVEAFGV